MASSLQEAISDSASFVYGQILVGSGQALGATVCVHPAVGATQQFGIAEIVGQLKSLAQGLPHAVTGG